MMNIPEDTATHLNELTKRTSTAPLPYDLARQT